LTLIIFSIYKLAETSFKIFKAHVPAVCLR